MLISIATKSQQLALQVGIISSLLPSLLLSGFMFPISSMPKAIQYITFIIPARHLLEILRALMVKGVGLEYLKLQVLFLCIVATIFIGLSFKKFSKRVD